jgi:hypothetical protein
MPELRATMGRRTRRRLGVGLLAYGVAGVLLLATFAAIANAAIERLALVDPAAGALTDASAALGDTANAFGGFNASLADAEHSTAQAATSARDASATASRLADSMSLSIFGAQPLLPLAQDFRREAADLDTLAKGLDTLSASLKANQDDVAKIRNDITIIRLRVDSARSGGISVEPLRALVLLIVLWLALPAIAALVAGVWLLRSATPRGA